jgi:hypothetical protein
MFAFTPRHEVPTMMSRRLRLACLPALGVAVTAALLLVAGNSLLDATDKLTGPDAQPDQRLKDRFGQLVARAPAEPEKGKEKKNPAGPLIGSQPAVLIGSLKEATEAFDRRAMYVDVQARCLSLLQVWTVANLLQGGMAVVVLVLAVRAATRHGRGAGVLPFALPALILVAALMTVLLLDRTGLFPLTGKQNVATLLQTAARKAVKIEEAASWLTGVGNGSIIAVLVAVPLALGALVHSSTRPAERLESDEHREASAHREECFGEFQRLLYCTSGLLVAGAVQVTVQHRLPELLFDDEFLVQHVHQMASGVGLLIGGVFTVALAFVFVPCGLVLGRGLPAAATGAATGATPAAPVAPTWLKEFLAVIAPLVAVFPVGKFL